MLTHSADEIALCGKPFLLPAHPTRRRTPSHPATLSMVQKKIKHEFILRLCACGQFILYVSITFSRFIHSASLHSLHYPSLHFVSVHFTHLSTAQQKQFPPFITQTCTQAFRVMASRLPTHKSFTHSGLLMPLQACQIICSIAFSHCICFYPHHKDSCMLYFFLRHITPA